MAIRRLAQLPQINLTLRHLYNLEKYKSQRTIIEHTSFLQQEIPKRLARRVYELDNLKIGPVNLSLEPSILSIRDLYFDSANRAMDHPKIQNIESAISFKNLIKDIKQKHHHVVEEMSQVVVHTSNQLNVSEKRELDNFLDSFYGSRIGIRTIIGQCVNVMEDHPGIIQLINPKDILDDIIEEVSMICNNCYAEAPDFIFHGDPSYQFTYIPAFLYYIYLEVLKNASRAVIESGNHNPIHIYQSKGTDDLIVKISDLGGGFPRTNLPQVYSYSYTTLENNTSSNLPMIAGLGYGVPLSRLYAQYFGGDLKIIPFEGIGTDVIIYINRLLDCAEKEY